MAELLDISKQRVTELAKRGVIKKQARGQYLLKGSVSSYCASLRQTAAGRGGEAAQLDLTKERARLAKEQADREAFKNAQSRNELVHADDVVREWADILRTVRAGVMAIPSRVGMRLSSLSVAEIAVIDRECRDVLEEISNDEIDAPEGVGSSQTAATDGSQQMG